MSGKEKKKLAKFKIQDNPAKRIVKLRGLFFKKKVTILMINNCWLGFMPSGVSKLKPRCINMLRVNYLVIYVISLLAGCRLCIS